MQEPYEHRWRQWVLGAVVWLLACAVRVWTQRYAHGGADWPKDNLSLVQVATGVILSGTALAGLPFLVWRRLRGLAFPIEPGDWIWTASALFQAAWMGFYVAAPLTSNSLLLQVAAFPIPLIVPIVLAVGATRLKQWPHWANGLLMIAAIRLAQAFVAFVPMIGHTQWLGVVGLNWLARGLGFASGCVLIFLIADDSSDRRRSWTHWIGIALGLSSLVLECLVLFVSTPDTIQTSIGP